MTEQGRGMFLEVRGLEKDFQGYKALDGVSIEVKEGETFGLIGPNGAGKTTLVRILTGQIAPTQGEILVNGRPIEPGEPRFRRRLGLVPQEPSFYGRLTPAENLALLAGLYGISHERASERVRELLEWAGLREHAGRQARFLSRGMQQRLSLAMGLVHDPEILFLDEPTSGLDPEARSAVWEMVRELSGQGRTIFMTTHNMEEADHLCHRLAILVRGRIRERGTPAEIKRLLGTDRLELRLEEEGLPELMRVCRELSLDCGEEEGVMVVSGDSLPEKLPLIASRLSGSLRDLRYREVTLEDAFLRFMEEVGN